MKYLVNRETKEHKIHCPTSPFGSDWRIVQADPEGWIKHDGKGCPLPDDALADVRLGVAGEEVKGRRAGRWKWSNEATVPITHYRPILDDKPAPQYDPRSVSFNPIDRLKSARQAAQAQAVVIPDAKVWNQAEGRDGKQYADGWNACREAMLAAQSQESEE